MIKFTVIVFIGTLVILLFAMFLANGAEKHYKKKYVAKTILNYQLETGECKLVATHDGFKYIGECNVTDETLRKYNAR